MAQTRVLKEHEVRKNELLDVAQGLFADKGYEGASVNAIIDKAGVSKGTFYHYFRSKEDLLDCLVRRVTDDILAEARRAAKTTTAGAAGKLSAFFLAAWRWKAANREAVLSVAWAVFRDENILMRYKGTRRWLEAAVPEIANVIREGIAEGVFGACDPEETAELILQLGVAMREALAGLFLRVDEEPGVRPLLERRIRSYQRAAERILGAPEGSIILVGEETQSTLRGTKKARVRHKAVPSAQTTLWPMPEEKAEG